jgi:hypothetical protein
MRRLGTLTTLLCALAAPAAAHAADRLPDLDQETPFHLGVVADRSGSTPRWHLGFDSAVDNVGAGPLIVDARRADTTEPRMTAEQLVLRADGTLRRRPAVGFLRFVRSPDHDHWHYLGFDRYQLRRAADFALVAPDRKTGFCLGDRYVTAPDDDRPAPEPVFTSRCGLGQPDLETMREGITPGFGDDYGANLEGQFVDVTGVPAGRYYLVHRVNADKKLLERKYSNNAASVLLALTWPKGAGSAPRVDVLKRCPASARCP